MWLNILGFVVSIIFYFSVFFNKPVPPETVRNPLQDTLLKIDFLVRNELKALQEQQDSLLSILRAREDTLSQHEKLINEEKRKIHLILKSDWDSLSVKQRERYTRELVNKFKKH